MAQIRNFTSTNDSYFILDGVSYPKVYEAMLDNGYTKDKVKLVGTNRDSSPLVFSTHYSNIRVDGASFANAQEAISRLNQVVFSKGGGSGDGGTTGDYIPLSGTEEGKPVTGIFKTSGETIIDVGDPFDQSYNIRNYSPYYDVETKFGLGTGSPGSYALIVSHLNPYKNIFFNNLNVQGDIRHYYMMFYSDNLEMGIGINAHKNPQPNERVGITISDSIYNIGLIGMSYFGDNAVNNSYIQKKYVDNANSYSTTETKTGGTWIDGKPIYTITQLTADPIPADIDTRFPDEIIGSYTVYKYTKTTSE